MLDDDDDEDEDNALRCSRPSSFSLASFPMSASSIRLPFVSSFILVWLGILVSLFAAFADATCWRKAAERQLSRAWRERSRT